MKLLSTLIFGILLSLTAGSSISKTPSKSNPIAQKSKGNQKTGGGAMS